MMNGTTNGTTISASVPPHSIEAEMALLGAVICDSSVVPDVLGIVEASDFYSEAHKTIFARIAEEHRSDPKRVLDLIVVPAALDRAGELERIGGVDYLAQLVTDFPVAANAMKYAQIVAELARRRDALRAIHRMAVALHDGGASNGEALAVRQALDAYEAVPTAGNASDRPLTDAELREAADALEREPRHPTGVPGLDDLLGGGYRAGWSIVVGAFTGGGKTMFARHHAAAFAARGYRVLVVTLELSAVEFRAGVHAAVDDVRVLERVSYYDTADLARVERVVRRWANAADGDELPPLLIVDYAQRLLVPATYTREREVAQGAVTLQRLARGCGLIGVYAAQLSREHQSQGRAPGLHDLRESGALEQIADVVVLIEKRAEDRLHLKIAKHRWGRAGGELELSCDFARARLGGLTAAQALIPLAEGVVSYLRSHDGKASLKDVCKNAGTGERGKHPRQPDVIEAARSTMMFRVEGEEVSLP